MRLSIISRTILRAPSWAYRLFLIGLAVLPGHLDLRAQIASFNFSSGSNFVAGWTNLGGDPAQGVQTATTGGITISSVSTANWSPNSNDNCALDGWGKYPGTYFPNAVMNDSWIQYNGAGNNLALYNELVPQLELTGLNPDSTYTLRMTGSNYYFNNTTVYTVVGSSVAGSQALTTYNNTSQGITFLRVAPDPTGMIKIYVNCASGLSGNNFSWICGVQVYSGSTNVGAPTVAISLPTNGTLIAEGGNVQINATASETAGSIAKVQFFSNTTLIGEVDTVPYNFTWVNPDPGSYTITVTATDATGTINSAMVSIGVTSLNYFWSTTGNVGNNADSTFIGNVDSVRLDFRTKDIQRMSITGAGNIGIGTISPTAQLHVAGSVRLAGLINDSTNADPRILVSDSSGNLAYRNFTGSGGVLAVGPGLGETPGGALALGDTVSGAGPHSFTSNRYEYLNGYQYSVGGSVNDPVNMPNFLLYNNGDWTAGTTMNRSVNTLGQTGMRYYSKLGVMQIGASDWLDTTQSKIVYGYWPGSGLLINTDTANVMKGKLMNTVFVGDNNHFDSLSYMENCFIAAGGSHFAPGSQNMDKVVVVGYGHNITAPVNCSLITGVGNSIAYPLSVNVITGVNNVAADTAYGTFVSGSGHHYGAISQFLAGQNLIDRVPYTTILGNANVDFPDIPYNGLRGSFAGGNPLFVVANSSSSDSSIRSNAVTVLYNGRTQINTTGFTSSLSETGVTPKAALEVVSTNTGVLLPKLTTAQRNAIASTDLVNGLLLYNTDSSAFQFYNGSLWSSLASSVAAGSGWGSAGNAGTNPAVNFIGTTDTARLAFRTDDIVRMTILSNGAVAIGTSSLPASDAQLAVNGAIYARKVKVTQTGWPDYVFDDRYTLPSLSSVERYIRQYKHLPGIISAREAEQKHVDLGDNQAALLKKIEELTLYLLAEHKKAEDQQEEIDRLKAENTKLADQQQQIDQLKEMVKKLTAKTN
jgi:hypothetical protein